MNAQRAKGKHLTAIGKMWGIKRKWFGLEPDFMYRRRILSLLITTTRPKCSMW